MDDDEIRGSSHYIIFYLGVPYGRSFRSYLFVRTSQKG